MSLKYILVIALFTLTVNADDDLDWELDFSIEEKSTIEDFPLKEISQEELSNAAIPGALKTTRVFEQSKSVKPAHAQEAEENDKRKINELEDPEENQIDENNRTVFILPDIAPIDFQQPTYKIPDGREYGHLETNTVERR